MDTELAARLQAQDEKLEAIFRSVEKTRKYFQAVFWITVVTLVVPFLLMLIVVPAIFGSFAGSLDESSLQEQRDLLRELGGLEGLL